MVRIMFVCHGNICRSPMAEFILKDMVKKQGIDSQFCIRSSATSTEEIWGGIGNPVYPPAKQILEQHGINPNGKRAVQLTKSDFEEYDYFVCMDSANMRNMKRILGTDERCYKLMSFAGKGADVSDPWYTRDFETCYEDIYEGCKALLEYIKANS